MEKDPDPERIAWHPAFFEAIQLELEQYKDALQFIYEYQLTKEPLRVDVLVVKKTKDVVIEKNIASIFRSDNLFEYKSPDDYVSVDDFYKVCGYACFYAALTKTPITEITLTFVESCYPRDLVSHLREVRGYEVAKTGAGIYTVTGDVLPMQILDSRELSSGENLWLRDLSNRLDAPALRQITEAISQQGKDAHIRAYAEAVFKANGEKVQEAFAMSEAAITFDMALEKLGLIAKYEARGEEKSKAKWEARGEERGEAIGEARKATEIARNLLGGGFSAEQTAQFSGLDIGQVRELAASH